MSRHRPAPRPVPALGPPAAARPPAPPAPPAAAATAAVQTSAPPADVLPEDQAPPVPAGQTRYQFRVQNDMIGLLQGTIDARDADEAREWVARTLTFGLTVSPALESET